MYPCLFAAARLPLCSGPPPLDLLARSYSEHTINNFPEPLHGACTSLWALVLQNIVVYASHFAAAASPSGPSPPRLLAQSYSKYTSCTFLYLPRGYAPHHPVSGLHHVYRSGFLLFGGRFTFPLPYSLPLRFEDLFYVG